MLLAAPCSILYLLMSILNYEVYEVVGFPIMCKNEKTAIFCFLFFVVWNLGSSELSSDFQASDRIDDKNSK